MSDDFDKEEIMKKLMELAIKQQSSQPNNDVDEYGDFKRMFLCIYMVYY